jgi:uncharacterized protein involved in exopolysaccharide biosynthesis
MISIAEIFKVIFGYRRIIIGICGIVALGSVVLSLLKPNYYKATTTVYAASQDLAMPEKIFGLTNTPMEYYGSDRETDRLMAAAKSNELFDAVIDAFDLIDHYEIDPASPQARLKARKQFSKFYEVRKNKLDAIDLSVEDTDPVKAAQLANGTRDVLNKLASEYIRKSQAEILGGLQKDINRKSSQLDTLTSELALIKKEFGIIDPKQQSELLTSKYLSAETQLTEAKAKLKALETANLPGGSKRDSIRKYDFIYNSNREILNLLSTDTSGLNIDKFNTGSKIVSSLETYYTNLRNQIARDKVWVQQVESAMNSDFPALLIIQQAQVPQRKFRPKRSLIVIGSVIGSLIFSIMGVLIHYSFTKMDWSFLKS